MYRNHTVCNCRHYPQVLCTASFSSIIPAEKVSSADTSVAVLGTGHMASAGANTRYWCGGYNINIHCIEKGRFWELHRRRVPHPDGSMDDTCIMISMCNFCELSLRQTEVVHWAQADLNAMAEKNLPTHDEMRTV